MGYYLFDICFCLSYIMNITLKVNYDSLTARVVFVFISINSISLAFYFKIKGYDMDIKTLNEEFRNFFEYTEEPDAFETQSEKEMEKQMEKEIDASYQKNKENSSEFFKKRNGGIKRIYSFLSKLKGVRDLRKSEGKTPYLACYISQRDFNFFNDWNSKENNVLKECGLQMRAENASQGYNIYIY